MVGLTQTDNLMWVAVLDASRQDAARSDNDSKTYPVLNQQDLTEMR